eukprot:Nk52_evm19s229 gene=Nk52_evmTU19s229
MVYTAHWQAVGMGGNGRDNGDPNALGETTIEQAQNDILSTIAKRTPKEHERERVQRQLGFGIGLSSLIADTVISYPLIIYRAQSQLNSFARSDFGPVETVSVLGKLYIRNGLCLGTILSRLFVKMANEGVYLSSQVVVETVAYSHKQLVSPGKAIEEKKWEALVDQMLIKCGCFSLTLPLNIGAIIYNARTLVSDNRMTLWQCIKHGFKMCLGMVNSSEMTSFRPSSFFLSCMIEQVVKDFMVGYIERKLLRNVRSAQRRAIEGESDNHNVLVAFYPELFATFGGRVITHLLLYPLETVNARLVVQGSGLLIDNTETGEGLIDVSGFKYDGFWDCASKIVRSEGFEGLYKGMHSLGIEVLLQRGILVCTWYLYLLVTKISKTTKKKKKRIGE